MVRERDNTGDESTPQATEAQLFAEMMCSAREVAGFSVAQLADATKISQNFIRALEEGRFDELPGRVFGRGFVRSICQVLDVDPTDYLEGYDLASGHEPGTSSASADITPPIVAKSEAPKRMTEIYPTESILSFLKFAQIPPAIWATSIGIIILVPLLVWIGGAPNSQERLVETVSTETQDIDHDPILDAAQVIAESEQEATYSLSEPSAVAETEEKAPEPVEETKALEVKAPQGVDGKQQLTVDVKYPVRIRVSLDGGAWETKKLESNSHSFEFDTKARMLILDAGAVEVSYNGKSLGFLGKKGRIRRLSFTKTDLTTKRQAM